MRMMPPSRLDDFTVISTELTISRTENSGVFRVRDNFVRITAHVKDWNARLCEIRKIINWILRPSESFVLRGEIVIRNQLLPVRSAARPYTFAAGPAFKVTYWIVGVNT